MILFRFSYLLLDFQAKANRFYSTKIKDAKYLHFENAPNIQIEWKEIERFMYRCIIKHIFKRTFQCSRIANTEAHINTRTYSVQLAGCLKWQLNLKQIANEVMQMMKKCKFKRIAMLKSKKHSNNCKRSVILWEIGSNYNQIRKKNYRCKSFDKTSHLQ